MNKYKLLRFFSVPVLILITLCFAQKDTLFLSLDDALNLAGKQSPARTEAAIDKGSGTLALVSGVAGILPTPSVQTSYSKTTTNLLNSSLTDAPEYQNTYSGSVGLNQVLFDPTAFGNVIKGKLYNDYYRLQAKDKTANLLYSVKVSYFTLAKTYKLYEVSQASLKRAEDNYTLAQEKHRLGQITKFELLRSETFKTQSAIDLLTAEKNLAISMQDLTGQLGIIDEVIIKPTTTPSTPELTVDFEALFSDITQKNPMLLTSQKYKSIAKTSFAQSIANLLPSANLFWSSTYSDTSMPKKITDWKDNDIISYGVRLNFPVFEIKSYLLNIGSSRNEVRRADVQMRKSEILLRKNATSAIYTYKETKERYNYASKNLELNRELLRLAQEQYRLGAISQLDLFNTEINFNTAQNTYYSALYDTYTSYAQIEYLLGISDK